MINGEFSADNPAAMLSLFCVFCFVTGDDGYLRHVGKQVVDSHCIGGTKVNTYQAFFFFCESAGTVNKMFSSHTKSVNNSLRI